jgi:hypothetical protein
VEVSAVSLIEEWKKMKVTAKVKAKLIIKLCMRY